MMYYITKAPNGSAAVSTVPPVGKPYVTLDKLPEGEGMLMINDFGRVFRVPYPVPPAPTTEERIAELEAINAELEDAMCEMDSANQEEITALNETVSALEDAVCEMDAMNEERMAAIEDALCEMDMG